MRGKIMRKGPTPNPSKKFKRHKPHTENCNS
jgi:hypothetical protein